MTTARGPLGTLRAILAGRLGVHDPRLPIGPDDLFPEDAGHTAPRIARFVGPEGSPHIGLVLESVEGLPRRLLDLTARHGSSPRLVEFVAAGGLELAERELEREGAATDGPDHVTLEREELPTRLLSPVDISAAELEAGARLVVGFGLTFRKHRHETGGAPPFAFPKPTVPTGACAPVSAGRDRDAPVLLLDYELELGCVPFRDIDLDRLDAVDPAADFGYLVVNDVSAREPIVRSRRGGYAHGKGRPTYLPAGPWLVPGTHFTRDEPSLRRMVLMVAEGEEAHGGGPGPHTLRQDARVEDLTVGVHELLVLLARRRALTMRGQDGRRWPVSVQRGGRRILPAGSLLLTGTPGGTAIRSPRAADKAALLVRSLRHLRWPSSNFRRHLEDHHQAFGFLAPGDRVSAWITGLGRQDWQVQAAG